MYKFLEGWRDLCIDGICVSNLYVSQDIEEPLGSSKRVFFRNPNREKYTVLFDNGIEIEVFGGYSEGEAQRRFYEDFRNKMFGQRYDDIDSGPFLDIDGRGIQFTNINGELIDGDMEESDSPGWTAGFGTRLTKEVDLKLNKDGSLNKWFENAVIGQQNTPELRTKIEKKLNEVLIEEVNNQILAPERITFNLSIKNESDEPDEEKVIEDPIDRFKDILEDDD